MQGCTEGEKREFSGWVQRVCVCVCVGWGGMFSGLLWVIRLGDFSQGEEKGKKLNDMRKTKGKEPRGGKGMCCAHWSACVADACVYACVHMKWKKLLPCGGDVLCYH